MYLAKRLDQTSSFLFFIGFVFDKIRQIPLGGIQFIFNLVAIGLYFVGYILWITACYLYPNHPAKQERWYGFSEFKTQYRTAALLGTVATLLLVASLLMSVIMIPAFWILVISNCIWFIGEYHKYQHPPTYDKTYSPERQQYYLWYASIITTLHFVTAISATSVFLMPIISVPVLIISSCVGLLFGSLAFFFWVKANSPVEDPDNKQPPQSYKQMFVALVFDENFKPAPTLENQKEEELIDVSAQKLDLSAEVPLVSPFVGDSPEEVERVFPQKGKQMTP